MFGEFGRVEMGPCLTPRLLLSSIRTFPHAAFERHNPLPLASSTPIDLIVHIPQIILTPPDVAKCQHTIVILSRAGSLRPVHQPWQVQQSSQCGLRPLSLLEGITIHFFLMLPLLILEFVQSELIV